MEGGKVVTFVAPQNVAVREIHIDGPGDDQLQVKTVWSAISAGTEMLAYLGNMPPDVATDETFEGFGEPFTYPCSYGYCAVGVVTGVGMEVEPSWIGKRVFSFQPHTNMFNAKCNDVLVIPDDVSSLDAVMFPSVETAVSLVMDAAPRAGDNVVVIGQGVVGLLTTALLKLSAPLSRVVTADLQEERRLISKDYSHADESLDPREPNFLMRLRRSISTTKEFDGADIAIDISGSGAGLNAAIEATGRGGKVVVGSWFGSKNVNLTSLGGRFHRSHMTVVASQVSGIPPSLEGRWTKTRRFDFTWKTLQRLRPSTLVSHKFALSEAAEAYRALGESRSGVLQIVFQHAEES